MLHSKRIPTAEFIAIKPNPRQRNTELHAKEIKPYLLEAKSTHWTVNIAEFSDGSLMKLDAHTRALLWKNKEIPVPPFLLAVMHPVKDIEEAKLLYTHFDSQQALEKQAHKVFGAFRESKFTPTSSLLVQGSITHALRMAYSVLQGQAVSRANDGTGEKAKKTVKAASATVYDMIPAFAYELAALDGLGLRTGQLPSGLVAAFLLSFRRYGHSVTPFWTAYLAKEGKKGNGRMDAVQALTEIILTRKNNKAYGGANNAEVCGRALMCIEYWNADQWVGRVPKALDTAGYLDDVKPHKERLIKRDVTLIRDRVAEERSAT